MTYRSLTSIFAVLSVCAVVACAGGGGGGSSAPPPPAATPTPTPSPTPAPSTCSSSSSTRIGEVGRRLAARAGGGIVPDQLYVRYRASAARSAQSVEKSVAAVRSVDLGSAGGALLRAVTLAPGSDAGAVTLALKQSPDVVEVSPVHYRTLLSDPAHGA